MLDSRPLSLWKHLGSGVFGQDEVRGMALSRGASHQSIT
jgi:hypothetical protein